MGYERGTQNVEAAWKKDEGTAVMRSREGSEKSDTDCIYVYYLAIDVHYVSNATE